MAESAMSQLRTDGKLRKSPEADILLTPGPWRVSNHDDCEICTLDGNVFIATSASPRNALAIAATPDLLGLVLELAEYPCNCIGDGTCPSCRAQRVIAAFESVPI